MDITTGFEPVIGGSNPSGSTKDHMNTSLQIKLTRITSSALFTAVVAGTWDAWWHGALGRESFWSPPHLLLYFSVLTAIAFGVYGWYQTKEKIWKRLAFILLLVPVSAPFDEIWHRLFGIEDISSPFIVWSPPHLILIGAVIASFICLLPIIRRTEENEGQRFFGALAFAGILSLLFFLGTPLQPIGPYNLLGFWGVGFIAALIFGLLLIAQKWMPGMGGVTLVMFIFLTISAIGFGEKVAPHVVIQPHEHPPAWLIVFSFLIPAVFMDLAKRKSSLMNGIVAAFLWSVILYGFSSQFFDTQFQYGLIKTTIAILAASTGGLVAAYLVSRIHIFKTLN